MSERKRRPQRRAPLPDPRAGQPQAANPELRAAVLEAVDTQLREGTPPETRETFARLVASGHTPEGARQLLAQVVVSEIFAVMASGRVYDHARFVAALRRLPQLPDEGEG
ncbi:MAG: hypothetical protein RLZZ387_3129 [Chloroflexota bacterium]|jgi:hypothetical protein